MPIGPLISSSNPSRQQQANKYVHTLEANNKKARNQFTTNSVDTKSTSHSYALHNKENGRIGRVTDFKFYPFQTNETSMK